MEAVQEKTLPKLRSRNLIHKNNLENIQEEREERSMDREEVVPYLEKMTIKYSYALYERIDTVQKYNSFSVNAEVLFENTFRLEYCGKVIHDFGNYIDFVIEKLTASKNTVIQVLGLPGSAKNMLLQLTFFKMLAAFRKGETNNCRYMSLLDRPFRGGESGAATCWLLKN